MPQQIFISLPVRDLPTSQAFYEAIGAVANPRFTDETAACMVWSDTFHVMLLTHAKWASFTDKGMVDARQASEFALAPTVDDRAAVDAMIAAAGAAGGRIDVNPPQDHGFMYQRTFEDPDGHLWEPFFMDMSKMPKKD